MTAEAVCRGCTTVLPAGFRFCPSCGAPVEAPAEDVRKTVTLLFCDVSGSTALGEQLDPEVLRSLMGEYFAVARAAVERHGGTVEKFVGDAVLAVFGIPLVREDDALRAVRAAAELRDGLSRLSAELEQANGLRLAVRTGLNTGAVVAGSDRAGGAFATGDAVNTAARLEQAASPGEVLLGATTYSLVRDAVEVVAVAPLTVKGKAEPLPAYQLVRVLDVDDGRTRRVDADLVGRDRERRRLDEALEMVAADGRPQLVTVLGAAGIGKSRLLAEFVDAHREKVTVLRGRCLSYGRGITFWPVVSVLREAAGLTGEEDDARVVAALQEVLRGAHDEAAVVQRLVPLLSASGEPGGTEETFWAVRSLLEHLADAGPVVVVVDDLHWAEPALLDLLEHLRDESRDVPLMLLCPARPELLESRPGWGGGAVSAMTLSLEPLSPEATFDLLAGLLGGRVPPDVAEAVNRWGDGNPLFLEEMTTHLLEVGLLVRADDGWALAGDLSTAQVPPTVTALLAARLDRLPAEERGLLERASVIGLELTRDELVSLLHGQDPAAALAALTRKGLLRRLRGGRGEGYAFRHVLVREAAYDALPKAQRAALHERYANRLGEHSADAGGEVEAFIAHHLEQAARLRRELAPHSAEAATLAERAAAALVAAAERARHADDAATAVALLNRGLELTPADHPARRGRLLRLAWAAGDVGRTEEGLAAVAEGLALGDDAEPDLVHLVLLAERLEYQVMASEPIDPDLLLEACARAEERARAEGDEELLCRVLWLSISPSAMAGLWRQTEAALSEIGNSDRPYERRTGRGWLLAAWIYGPRPYDEALALLDADGPLVGAPPGSEAMWLLHRAVFLMGVDRVDEALDHVRRAWTLIDALADPGLLVRGSRAFLSPEVLRAAGDDEAALREVTHGGAWLRQAGGLAYASTLFAQQGMFLLERGEDVAAAAALAEASELMSPYDVMSVGLVRCGEAVLASRQGDQECARALAHQAIEVIDRSDQLDYRAHMHAWLSEIPAREGDLNGQRRELKEALRLHREKRSVPFVRKLEGQLAALD